MGTAITPMTGSAIPGFAGTSTFATDLQQSITRATQIASLPIQVLNNNITDFNNEQQALGSLSTVFASLQTALAGVDTVASSGNFSVSYSNTGVTTVTASTGALHGIYTLQVNDPGSQASAVSTAAVTDPATQSISSSGVFTLTANGQTYANIVPPPSANTLTSLVTAINTATQGAVQATIVNVGTPSQPSYQLSIQNTAYGALPITLTDSDGNNLLNAPTDATSVQYMINGQGPISSDTRTPAIAPNLTAKVLGAGTTNITVTQSTTSLANVISKFVSAYNAASQALSGQQGQGGGALSGSTIVHTLTRSLQNLVSYTSTGSGTIQSLSDIGITFEDTTGQLSFNSDKLSSAAASDFTGVLNFLGSTADGGFLQAGANALNGVLDPASGAIPTELNTLSGQITSTNDRINQDQNRVNQLQANLAAQMTAADALIAQLQSQVNYLTSMFNAQTAYQNQISHG